MSETLINIGGQITSLLYIFATIIIYIRQKKILTIENRIFIRLLIVTPIVLVVNIINTIGPYYFSFFQNNLNILNITTKIYMVTYISWLITFTYYIYTTNSIINIGLVSYKDNPYQNYFEKVKTTYYLIFILLSIIQLILRVDIIEKDYNLILYGPAYNYFIIVMYCCIVAWIFIMISNRKMKIKRNIPNIVAIVFIIIVTIVEYFYQILDLYSTIIAFTTMVLYFCIENPDIKLIEDLNIATKQAEKANKDKTAFLVDMYHQIKTPLTAIFGFSETLKGEKLDRKSMSEAEEIYSSSNHLLKIINKLLDIADIENGKVKLNNQEYDSHKLFNQVATLGKVRLSKKNIKFIYQKDENIPPVLYGDGERIKQILMNLITNATRYTEEGFITFAIKSKIENDNCHLTIMVDDSGRGMNEQEQETAFNSYSHIHISSASTGAGSGLGLALTKKLLETMGGTILLVSDKGKGSRFTIVLTQKIANKTIEEITKPKPKEITYFNASGTKVLVVDDNAVNLKVAKHLLKEYKIDADTCESGNACLDKIQKGYKYDIIFMDEIMPTLSGTRTLSELIKISDFKSIVIALTANNNPDVIKQCKMIGYNDYLEKPIDKYELYQILNKYARNEEYPRENIYYKI